MQSINLNTEIRFDDLDGDGAFDQIIKINEGGGETPLPMTADDADVRIAMRKLGIGEEVKASSLTFKSLAAYKTAPLGGLTETQNRVREAAIRAGVSESKIREIENLPWDHILDQLYQFGKTHHPGKYQDDFLFMMTGYLGPQASNFIKEFWWNPHAANLGTEPISFQPISLQELQEKVRQVAMRAGITESEMMEMKSLPWETLEDFRHGIFSGISEADVRKQMEESPPEKHEAYLNNIFQKPDSSLNQQVGRFVALISYGGVLSERKVRAFMFEFLCAVGVSKTQTLPRTLNRVRRAAMDAGISESFIIKMQRLPWGDILEAMGQYSKFSPQEGGRIYLNDFITKIIGLSLEQTQRFSATFLSQL